MNIGDRFEVNSGQVVEVVAYENAYKVTVRFLDTGNTRVSQAVDVRLGRCKDKLKPSFFGVGFAGYGKHRYKSDAGRKWSAMMRRCYDEKWKKNKPSYDGVSVCEEWHSLQNFGDWFESQNTGQSESVDLDKDMIQPGCKVYSPETCSLIPHSKNVSLTAAGGFKLKHKSGQVILINNAVEFCKDYGIDRSNLSKVIKGKHSHCKGWSLYED